MSSTPLHRSLDAALNRAGEGLRVIEDYVRFALDDQHLTAEAKSLRHDLSLAARTVGENDRFASRDTRGDVGTGITTAAEASRPDQRAVCAASFKRLEQSLRSLEEYGKLLDTGFATQMESLRYRTYTLEKAVGIGRESRQRLAATRLMVLVGGGPSCKAFEQLVGLLVQAGVDAVQLREKNLDDRPLLERARLLRRLTHGTATLAVVNDRADIAALSAADAVHLGQEDLSVKEARTIVGPEMLIGVSTHHMEQARTAVLGGANYLGAGPTFPSQTKSFTSFAGLAYLRELAAETTLPVFAIGGIKLDNLSEVIDTGITRVAVSGAVTGAIEPGVAARALSGMLNSPVVKTTSPS